MMSPASPRRRPWVPLVAFLVLNATVLAVGGWLTSAGRGDGWYESLRKPPFQPPDWVFGPVWTVLMALTAVATWRVWTADAAPGRRRLAVGLYGLQLLFNLGWSGLFFYLHRPVAALAEIVAFGLLLAGMILAYGRIDRIAAVLLAPYLIWVLFATTLNGWIAFNN